MDSTKKTARIFGFALVALAALGLTACVVDNGKQKPTPPPGQVGQPTTNPTTGPAGNPGTPPVDPKPTVECPDESNPTVKYTSKDPGVCARALFRCEPGQTLFTNECGCGCVGEAKASTCPDDSLAGVSYKSKDAKQCARMRFACAAGEKPFSNAECGCGCEPSGSAGTPTKTPTMPPQKAQCPAKGTAGVTYKSEDGNKCARMRFACKAGEDAFSAACGCGCKPKAKTTNTTPNSKCPEASITGVDYKSKDVNFCSRARIGCGTGTKPFSSPCGCGCVPK